MNTPEGRQFSAEIARELELAFLHVEARTACTCGCGKPDRVEFSVAGHTTVIIDPRDIDRLIASLTKVRAKLWGQP